MKKAATITLTFLILTVSWAAACTCPRIDKKVVESMFNEADFVIIGKALTNVEQDSMMLQSLNQEMMGSDVLFKVGSVLKGDVQRNDTLFIYQFSGSCTSVFEFGDSYMIFGNRINKFKEVEYTGEVSEGEIPPPPYIVNGELEVYADTEFVSFLNNQKQKYKTLTTDLCSTLHSDSKVFADAIKHIKKLNRAQQQNKASSQ